MHFRCVSTDSPQFLSVNNLEVVYDDVIQVLRGVSLTVPEGQIVALLGANGAGKTTLLLAITGLLDVNDGEITKGSVVFDAQEIHHPLRQPRSLRLVSSR